jgi:hypothetical protein
MSSQEEASDNNSMPDLIVNECLFGCEGCPAIWENSQTGHRIICKCVCGHIMHKNNDETVLLRGASLVGSHTVRQAAALSSPNTFANQPKTKGRCRCC